MDISNGNPNSGHVIVGIPTESAVTTDGDKPAVSYLIQTTVPYSRNQNQIWRKGGEQRGCDFTREGLARNTMCVILELHNLLYV
jgi:hypothetical protein